MSSLTPAQRAQIRALLDADEQGVPVTEWDEFRRDISGGRWTRVSRIVTYADMIACSTAPAPHYRQYQRRRARGGVEDVVMAARNAENAIRNCAAAGQIGEDYVQYADDLRDAVQRLSQQLAAAGEEIMVNTPYDVFTLPLQPSGLSSGPRFVVHVPGPEQPAGVEGMQRRLDREESDHGRTIDQRDAAEDALGRMFQAVTGQTAEWSSAWGYVDAIEEVEEHVATLAAERDQLAAALEAAREDAEPVVRFNDDGTLDEVVGRGQFHLEQMGSGHWWMQLGPHIVNLSARGKIRAHFGRNEAAIDAAMEGEK